jgi:hypothetical protein
LHDVSDFLEYFMGIWPVSSSMNPITTPTERTGTAASIYRIVRVIGE